MKLSPFGAPGAVRKAIPFPEKRKLTHKLHDVAHPIAQFVILFSTFLL